MDKILEGWNRMVGWHEMVGMEGKMQMFFDQLLFSYECSLPSPLVFNATLYTKFLLVDDWIIYLKGRDIYVRNFVGKMMS